MWCVTETHVLGAALNSNMRNQLAVKGPIERCGQRSRKIVCMTLDAVANGEMRCTELRHLIRRHVYASPELERDLLSHEQALLTRMRCASTCRESTALKEAARVVWRRQMRWWPVEASLERRWEQGTGPLETGK